MKGIETMYFAFAIENPRANARTLGVTASERVGRHDGRLESRFTVVAVLEVISAPIVVVLYSEFQAERCTYED